MLTPLDLSLSADGQNEMNQSLAGFNAGPKSQSGSLTHCLPAHLPCTIPRISVPRSKQQALFELGLLLLLWVVSYYQWCLL